MNKKNIKKEIPAAVLETFFSEKTVSRISKICLENEIKDGEKIKEIAKQIGLVLLGKLPSNNLSKTLQEKLRLEKNIAENIYFEANRLIFSQVQKKSEKPLIKKNKPIEIKTEKKPKKKDIYLEPIE